MTFKYRYRKQIIISILSFLLICSIITGILFSNREKKILKNEKKSSVLLTEKKNLPKKKKLTKKDETKEEIMVDVKGEVVNSGIYRLKKGSRVIDAIHLAGGVTQNGDTSVLNLSKKLEDEMVIIVYSYYEVRNFEKTKEVEAVVRQNCITGDAGVMNDACIEQEDSTTNQNSSKKISLNQATVEELMSLSGIGESKAKSIIEYRNSNGGFKSIEELKKVSGIGEALFDKIKENITL